MQQTSFDIPPQLFLEESNLYINQRSIYTLNTKDGAISQIYPSAGQLSIATDAFYLNVNRFSDSSVQAIRKKDGSVLWSYKTNGRLIQSPIIYKESIYICTAEGEIYALLVQDGTLQWHISITRDSNIPSFQGPIILTPPLVISDVLYVTSMVNSPTQTHLYAFRVNDGTLLWQTPVPEANSSSFITSNKRFYLPMANGYLSLNTNDGAILWQKRLERMAHFLSQPVVSDTNIYVCDSKGNVIALRETDRTVLWQSFINSTPITRTGFLRQL